MGAFTMCVLKCKIECVKLVDEMQARIEEYREIAYGYEVNAFYNENQL